MRTFLPLLLPLLAMVFPVGAQPRVAPGCVYRIAEDFVPMTPTERLRQAEFSVASATPVLFSAVRAGVGYQPRDESFGERLGSYYAEDFIGQFAEQGLSYKLHEDNRYFASGKRNPVARLGYAIESTLLARHDDGSRGISISGIGGAATGAFISRAWQPRNTTSAGDAAVSFGMTLAIRAGFNVLREFSPRFFGRLLH